MAGLIFFSKQGDYFISPHTFQAFMEEIAFFYPFCFVWKGKPSCCGRKMNMHIPFKISSKRVYGKIDAWIESLLLRQCQDDPSSYGRNFIHQVTIHPEKFPEHAGHGECNMLPGRIRKRVKTVLYPVVCSSLPARRAKSRFAGMGCFKRVIAIRTDIRMIPQKAGSACQHFDDIDDNAPSEAFSMLDKKLPPVAIINKYVAETYSCYDFHIHQYMKVKFKSKEKLRPEAA